MSKVYTRTELIRSVEILKLTVPRMNNLCISLTPENYAVWYEYSQGTCLDLNREIDDMLNEGTKFTREINEGLYNNYIDTRSPSELKKIQIATKMIIEQLAYKMLKMSDGSTRFGNALGECQRLLEEKPDVNQLISIVGQVLDESETVNQTNKEMMSSLRAMEQEVDSLKSGVESLTKTVLTDELTGIANRRAFDQEFEKQLKIMELQDKKLCVLLIDIDNFKHFNDKFGHALGDKVLVYVANSLNRGIASKEALAARYGGEEFVILLVDCAYNEAVSIANSLRVNIASKNLKSVDAKNGMGKITISIGVGEVSKFDSSATVIERADKAMYLAKETGRNRVCGEQDLH